MVEIRRKILVAMRQEGVVAAERALGGYVEIVPSYTFEDAVRRLETQEIRLILCGMYFAETRMFDLLRFVKERFPSVLSSRAVSARARCRR